MHTWRAGAVLAVLVTAEVAISEGRQAGAGPSVAQLGWLAGCLELRTGDRVVEEQPRHLSCGKQVTLWLSAEPQAPAGSTGGPGE